ncbi:hypothetical protein DSO57_1034514 [Entomophthora muscae]|uniref:Uncharacterized protein n=1 Tax=Entomophthora muscae TaxID=34485 RepID=A0ACC2UJN7_9FUNG|nr:hypothetical protein DSO57_1034514 [Entomophthora muscae]
MELPGEFRDFSYQNEIYPVYILGELAGRIIHVDSDPLTVAKPGGERVTAIHPLIESQGPHDLNIISIVDGEIFTLKTTHGSFPNHTKGFSAAHRCNLVYIVASNHVYIFDLETYTWQSHLVPGLVAARSGCLYLHKTTLIYAFGMVNGGYSSKTHFIDTINWRLTNQLGSSPKPTTDQPKTDLALLIILGISSLALLISIAIYLFVRFRRHHNALPLPEFYTEKIWANPEIFTCSLDYNLNSDPASSFDKTLPSTPSTPFSSNNIFNY